MSDAHCDSCVKVHVSVGTVNKSVSGTKPTLKLGGPIAKRSLRRNGPRAKRGTLASAVSGHFTGSSPGSSPPR